MSHHLTERIKHALMANGHALTIEQHQQYTVYLTRLQQWNRVFNLTRLSDDHAMVYLHLIDSLSARAYLVGTRFLDVGSGAGFPGLALAIAAPDQQWTLLDKNRKKIHFLTQVVAELGLQRVQLVHSDTDTFCPERSFDSVVSRAFGSLVFVLEKTGHLLQSGGQWLIMKGHYPTVELQALSSDQLARSHVHAVRLEGVQVTRHLVCLVKS